MWLILHAPGDPSAIWAYQGLRARGLNPLQLISAETLAYSLRWEHRISGGDVSIFIEMADCRKIHSQQISGVLNRLTWLPSEHLALANPADRDYAAQEWTAFFMSWLRGLPPPVLNQASAQGLSGPYFHASEWICRAADAGLATPVYRFSSRDPETEQADALAAPGTLVKTALVVGQRVIGQDIPLHIREGCYLLAQRAGVALLGVDFMADWVFAGATPTPDLRLGGRDALDALYAELTVKGALV